MRKVKNINAVRESKSDDDEIMFLITKRRSLVTNVVTCEVGIC